MKLSLGGSLGRLSLGLALAAVARADLATEEPFLIDDGENLFEAVLKGYAGNSHLEDMSEYTIVANTNGRYVYGETDDLTGLVESTSCGVNECNPMAMGLATRQMPTLAAHLEECGEFCKQPIKLNPKIDEYKRKKLLANNGIGSIRRNLGTGITLKNLVVLLRFKDHKDRELPSNDIFEKLFNSESTDQNFFPTGSIRTLFKQNSFDELTLDSVVHGWIDLDITEKEAAFPKHGLGSKALARAMIKTLEDLEAGGLDFTEFDVFNLGTNTYGTGDDYIDAVTFIHSGYGAEWGGTDCDGAFYDDRIWSHKYAFRPILKWEEKKVFISKKGSIKVDTYHISPGLWGTCENDIGRIGVIAHETGHFLGITDLYDTNGGGSGIGSFCLMANSWGFDGSQHYPPIMSAWTKIELGYVDPTEITADQINQGATFSIGDSSRHAEAFKITYGFPSGEYLLIENRLAVEGYLDYKIPGDAGLAIWHIDMNAASHSNEGYPDPEKPSWPENGDHYKIALLQADGEYHLERGQGRGSKGDLFNSQGAYEINPNGVMYADGTTTIYPNTDSYAFGNIVHTMIRIFDISESREQMSFSVGLFDGSFPTASPTKAPTMNPTYDPNGSQKALRTTMAGGNGRNGNTFSITAKTDVMINGFVLHIGSEDFLEVKIYLVQGGHYDTSSSANKVESEWELYSTTNDVKGMGLGNPTNFNIENPIQINQGETMGFYIVLNERVMKYTNEGDANKRNQVTYVNDHIEFIQGFGMSENFSENQYKGRIFNGEIKYIVSPSSIVTASPT
eukprot:scaffold204661_cov37-Attheya_sp.AAC.1